MRTSYYVYRNFSVAAKSYPKNRITGPPLMLVDSVMKNYPFSCKQALFNHNSLSVILKQCFLFCFVFGFLLLCMCTDCQLECPSDIWTTVPEWNKVSYNINKCNWITFHLSPSRQAAALIRCSKTNINFLKKTYS